MTVSFDLRRNIGTVLGLWKCAINQCALNIKREKTNEESNCRRGIKAKRSKTKGHKTNEIYTKNGMININLTGCSLVTFI
jgi:hypothetical protein